MPFLQSSQVKIQNIIIKYEKLLINNMLVSC